MKPLPSFLRSFLALASAVGLFAQSTESSSTPAVEQTVVLSPFTVSTSQPGRYQADESASGGRIRTSIMDTPATVTVLTNEFINDIGTLRVLDAAKYVAGISEATIPNGLDRVNIRGFQSDGRRVDGFSTNDQANYDSAGIERMEVIKGPDALLQPAGVPGGTINLVTKTPQFQHRGYVKVQAGQYDSNRVEVDDTGPLGAGKKFAYRVVAALHDSEGYIRDSFRTSLYVMPSLTWRIAPNAQLTVRYEYYDFKTANLEGIAINPSVSTNDELQLLPGVAHDFSATLGEDYQFRKVTSHTGSFLFTGTVSDHLSVRLAGRMADIDTPDSALGLGPNTQGGARDPRTGLWVGGTVFGGAPTFTASAAPTLSHTFTHAGTNQKQQLYYTDLQNDWAYTVETDRFSSVTSAGLAYGFEHQSLQANAQTATPVNIDSPVAGPATAPTQAAPNTDRRRELTRMQYYLTERVELLDKRVILSVGAANVSHNGFFGNSLSAATATAVAGQMYPGEGNTNTVNYGIVVKPRPNLSLYYGHSENAVPTTNFQQVASGSSPVFAEGTQDEFGLKVQLLNNRLLASVSYYEIEQTGYSLANPANLTSPPPPVLLPPLVTSRTADGWEFQLTASVTKNLSVIAAYADTTNRDPNGVPFRGSAEVMGSFYVRYAFLDGTLDGLAVGFGANYLGKRAGDQASGITAASTSTNIIPNQPSYYLPARTLADLNFSYTRKDWSFRLAVNNLFDEVDYAASQTRFSVYMGNPRNVSGSVTYKF